MSVPVSWVDAFASSPFAGNPAAVCWTEAPADESWMQGLAGELAISETCFVTPGEDVFGLRWFTPTTEIDLCGHATLAAAHVLRQDRRVPDDQNLRFDTRSGILSVRQVDDLLELDLPADPAQAATLPDPLATLADTVVVCSRSRAFLVLELRNESAVAAFVPDLAAMRQLPDQAVMVTARSDRPDLDYVLRMFGPRVGIDEDPVTGSAQCTLGPYWAGRLGTDRLEVAQLSSHGGRARVEVRGDRVGVAGAAVTVLRGEVEGP